MKRSMFSSIDKVSALLLMLGQESAAALIGAMRDDEVRMMSFNMAQLGIVQIDSLERICNEFLESMRFAGGIVGSYEKTHDLLQDVLPKERVSSIMEDISGPVGRTMWDKFSNVSEDSLANYLKNEHPQTVAVVLSMVKASHAAKILTRLPEAVAFEVVVRMLKMEAVQGDILSRVENLLRVEFMSNFARALRQDPHKLVAEIFNNLDRLVETKFINELDLRDRDSSDRIKAHMFTFEDLIRVVPSDLQLLIRKVDKSSLALALKGSTDRVKSVIMGQLSERAATMLGEEISSMRSVKVRDVDEAQLRIIKLAKEMAANGEIDITPGEDDRMID